MTSTPWLKILVNTKVADILEERKIVKAQYEEEIPTLIQKMSEARVSSAVVEDSNVGIIGFVDVVDILSSVLEITSNSTDITKERLHNLKWEGLCYSRQQSGALSNLSQLNPFLSVSKEATLLDVMKIFAKGIHRLAVIDDKHLSNVISQSDITNFLATHGNYANTKMGKPLGEVGLAPLGVKSVREDVNAVEVIRFMKNTKTTGVPIVNKNGQIIANFSATDLTGLNENNFHFLQLPVMEFLVRMQGYPMPPVVTKATDTVESCLLKFTVHKVHRVYFVDENLQPTGVCTLTDLMQWFLATSESQ